MKLKVILLGILSVLLTSCGKTVSDVAKDMSPETYSAQGYNIPGYNIELVYMSQSYAMRIYKVSLPDTTYTVMTYNYKHLEVLK